jgi:hypothetical protein
MEHCTRAGVGYPQRGIADVQDPHLVRLARHRELERNGIRIGGKRHVAEPSPPPKVEQSHLQCPRYQHHRDARGAIHCHLGRGSARTELCLHLPAATVEERDPGLGSDDEQMCRGVHGKGLGCITGHRKNTWQGAACDRRRHEHHSLRRDEERGEQKDE